jgi:hypothetical protein
MIVVEGGARYVGREVPINVTRMHQTVAGKMVFGQVKESTKVAVQAPKHTVRAEPITAKSKWGMRLSPTLRRR